MRSFEFFPIRRVPDGNLALNRQSSGRTLRRDSIDDSAVLRRPAQNSLSTFLPRGVHSIGEGQQHQTRATQNEDKNPPKMPHMQQQQPLLVATVLMSIVSAGIILVYYKSRTLK